MKTSLSLAFLFACLSLFAQTSSRPLRFYESIAAMVANRPITNEVLAVTQRSGTNAGPLLFFWHAPTSAPTNTVDTFNAIGGGQLRLITNVVTVAISDGSITTNKWDSVAHQWVSGKQGQSSILSSITNLPYATGDLIYWNGSGFAQVPLGPQGYVLTVGTNVLYYTAPGGGGSGNAYTNQSQAFALNTTNLFLGTVILGGPTTVSNLTANAITADSATYTNPLNTGSGGTGASTVSGAQTNLNLIPGVHVQEYSALLKFLATNTFAPYDILFFDGTKFAKLALGTNNQVVGVSGAALAYINQSGASGSVTNATAFPQLADVNINTNSYRRNDVIAGWNGSNKWVRIPAPSAFANSDRYEEWYVGCTTTTSQSPYASTTINSGSGNGNAGALLGRAGYIRATTASSSAALYTGSSWMTGVTHYNVTNEYYFHAELRASQTNGAAGRIGFFDHNSTNAFNHIIGFAVTNNVWRFVAGLSGNFTLSSSYTPDTNYWHEVEIAGTNSTATIQVYTNGVLAFADSITSTNVPVGATLGVGVSFFGNAAASTNGQDLIVINDLGHRYSKY